MGFGIWIFLGPTSNLKKFPFLLEGTGKGDGDISDSLTPALEFILTLVVKRSSYSLLLTSRVLFSGWLPVKRRQNLRF